MKISAKLAADMRWLIETEQWGEVDKQQARDALKGDVKFFSHFFEVYIEAKRRGYKFFDGGKYVKLGAFCAEHGLLDPYMHEYTDSQIYGD